MSADAPPPSRNALCPCGSGKRYKHCHGAGAASAAAAPAQAMVPPLPPRMAALEAHRAGQLGRAEALYRRALEENPADVDCQHMLGVVQMERMRYREALDLLWGAAEATNWAVPDIRAIWEPHPHRVRPHWGRARTGGRFSVLQGLRGEDHR